MLFPGRITGDWTTAILLYMFIDTWITEYKPTKYVSY
jgi:hypothetical protein